MVSLTKPKTKGIPMKKLTDADYELLKARGKVTSLTTVRGIFSLGAVLEHKERIQKPKVNKYLLIHQKAHKAGMEALNACIPTPMVVSQHTNPLNDNSPVKKQWFVPQGACGFAWVNVRCNGSEGRKFINALKKEEIDEYRKDDYYGGYTLWVHYGNQSIELKEAYAYAYASVLQENNIKCYANSRLD
jgi:hypothetical protein